MTKNKKDIDKKEMQENSESTEQTSSKEDLANNEVQEKTGSSEIEAHVQEIEKLKEKISQSENQYLRLLADYQNLQKRTTQEKEELYKYAAQKTIETILPALDTYDYAKSSLKPDSGTEKIIEDFNLVFDSLIKSLKEIGLEAIEETGIPFDPVFHEPLNQIPTNDLPNHTVMQILKKGYMLNKKVIRPALVSVSVQQQQEEPPEPIASG